MVCYGIMEPNWGGCKKGGRGLNKLCNPFARGHRPHRVPLRLSRAPTPASDSQIFKSWHLEDLQYAHDVVLKMVTMASIAQQKDLFALYVLKI